MPSCAVLGCKTGYVPGKVAFQTFCFPTSNKLKQLWTEKVNRKNWQPNKYSRVYILPEQQQHKFNYHDNVISTNQMNY